MPDTTQRREAMWVPVDENYRGGPEAWRVWVDWTPSAEGSATVREEIALTIGPRAGAEMELDVEVTRRGFAITAGGRLSYPRQGSWWEISDGDVLMGEGHVDPVALRVYGNKFTREMGTR